MYKANKKHLQPLLISNVNDLPDKHRKRLEESWAGVFYQEFFCRMEEGAFAGLYAATPSRPNTAVNVLVGLEALKANFGWSDEELYDHFVFDVQVRYALGYRDLKEGEFDLRTLYNFRRRLSEYNLEKGKNLLQEAFARITDQQIIAFKVRTEQQRMDSTQIASNILDATRLELAVEAIQRLQRLLRETDQAKYAEVLTPYLKGDAGQFVYRIKGKQDTAEHLLAVGKVLYHLLDGMEADYQNEAVYQVMKRFFAENYQVSESKVEAKDPKELVSGSLQSLDDLEASFRQKGNRFYKGYVTNVSETCDPQNPVQLITQVQVAPNNVEDADLLIEGLADLQERTDLKTLYTDGGYGSPDVDEALNQAKVDLYQTAIRGKAPSTEKLNLADLIFELDENGKPLSVTCPQQQRGSVEASPSGYIAFLDGALCRACPFFADQRCRARRFKPDRNRFNWAFSQKEFLWAQRRKRFLQLKLRVTNPRTAVEATMRSVKHAFPASKLPVRGRFRIACMMSLAAAMINIRRIHAYLSEIKQKTASENVEVATPMLTLSSTFRSFWSLSLFSLFSKPCFSC